MTALQELQAPPHLRRKPGRQILVVEDDLSVGQILSVTLEQAGYVVTHARNVAAAAATLGPTAFDMCIVDMHLPDGTGLDVLRTMVAYDPDMPVVMLSGARQDALIATAMKLGAEAYVTKPFSPSKLTSLVDRCTGA